MRIDDKKGGKHTKGKRDAEAGRSYGGHWRVQDVTGRRGGGTHERWRQKRSIFAIFFFSIDMHRVMRECVLCAADGRLSWCQVSGCFPEPRQPGTPCSERGHRFGTNAKKVASLDDTFSQSRPRGYR